MLHIRFLLALLTHFKSLKAAKLIIYTALNSSLSSLQAEFDKVSFHLKIQSHISHLPSGPSSDDTWLDHGASERPFPGTPLCLTRDKGLRPAGSTTLGMLDKLFGIGREFRKRLRDSRISSFVPYELRLDRKTSSGSLEIESPPNHEWVGVNNPMTKERLH
ncbi:hypothetical protein BP6252_07580 [Coleophoma cylindrospora]|uniref:Uncharacterized protein n=1 Tax=Coleophoma cylindrospora TaxID=1849047 RepID=A0A3D8RAE2_9HELO|nr:hypothetical protein BP6252_07580 [Coleophoma cylindrospora]